MRLAGALVLVAAMTACGGSAAGPEFTAQDVAAIRTMTTEFQAAFNDGAIDRLMEFYPAVAVYMPPNSSTIRGPESIRGFIEELFAEGATGLELESADIGGAGNIAYQSGTFIMTTRPDGGGEWRDRGKFLFVLRKGGNQWRYDYSMWSSDLPEPTVITPPPAAEPASTN